MLRLINRPILDDAMSDDPLSTPNIISFVIRFVGESAQPAGQGPASPKHGAIRHIQSGAEVNFTQWSDAERFMARFVELDLPDCPPESA